MSIKLDKVSYNLVHIEQKMKFSIKDFSSKCDQIRSSADLVTFTEEILNGKLPSVCSVGI